MKYSADSICSPIVVAAFKHEVAVCRLRLMVRNFCLQQTRMGNSIRGEEQFYFWIWPHIFSFIFLFAVAVWGWPFLTFLFLVISFSLDILLIFFLFLSIFFSLCRACFLASENWNMRKMKIIRSKYITYIKQMDTTWLLENQKTTDS